MPERINVGVIFGGRSVEHEVSVITAYQAIEALDRQKYHVTPVYMARDNVWYIGKELKDISFFRQDHPPLKNLTRVLPGPDASRGRLRLVEADTPVLRKPRILELDVVIPATHGSFGEDGSLQGLLEMAGVPYAGSNVSASAVGMDKLLTKSVLKTAGIPSLPYIAVNRSEFEGDPEAVFERVENNLGYPVIVKPATLGSSVGVSSAGTRDELEEALELTLRFGEKSLIEEYVSDGIEINCAVLDGDPPTPSVLEQPVKSDEHLTFDEKYKSDQKGVKDSGSKGSKGMAGHRRIIPAPIEDELAKIIQDYAIRTYTAIGAGGVARIDFLINENNSINVIEINSIPGSFAYYLWEQMGRSFTELLDYMIERAIEIRKRSHRTIYSFEANLLAE
ncbi:D-alanine--D-alanine ligase [bacterium]|nr:D-alanine--D-alanine ligase [bacterium]